tara:strand:+ start:245 stop:631 length:387 start_codon:yes stop_codon:yes gene_type:complete
MIGGSATHESAFKVGRNRPDVGTAGKWRTVVWSQYVGWNHPNARLIHVTASQCGNHRQHIPTVDVRPGLSLRGGPSFGNEFNFNLEFLAGKGVRKELASRPNHRPSRIHLKSPNRRPQSSPAKETAGA